MGRRSLSTIRSLELKPRPRRLDWGGASMLIAIATAGVVGWHEIAFGEGTRLTLADAVASALHSSDAMHIAKLEADQAKDVLAAERSSYLPHLSVTSGAGYSNRQNQKLRAVDAEGNEKVYGLQSIGAREGWLNVEVEQLIFDLGSWRRIDQQALAAEAAGAAEDERRDTTARDVTVAYTNVLRLGELSALAAERTQQATWLDDQAVRLLRAGRAVSTEREQTAIAAAEAESDARALAVELAEARAALQLVSGDPSLDVAQLDPTSLPPAEPPPGDLASDQALAETPALRVLDLRRRVEESGLDAARAQRYPTVGLRAGYSNYGPNRYNNYPDEVGFNVAFRMPLFDGNRATHEVASATKGAEIAHLRYRALLDSKRARVRELAGHLATAHERSELATRRAILGRERMRLSDLSLQTQRGTLAEAGAAHDAFAHQASAAVEARYDRIETWTNLMSESGRLVRAILSERDVPVPAAP